MSTNHNEQKFNTQIGQSATVQRTVEVSEDNATLNAKLRDIGAALNPIKQGDTKYMGSAAMHVYWNEPLRQIFVVSQVNTMNDCPEALAIKGSKDFMGSLMEQYARKRPKLRSGF